MTRPASETRAPESKATRVGIVSLGCAKNLVDTEVMMGHLERAGCVFVNDPAEADVIVVNTCSFIDAAREESIRTILELAQHRESGSLKRLVVAGCMVQRYAEELTESLPEVDAFIGLDQLDRITEGALPGSHAAPLRDAPAGKAGGELIVPPEGTASRDRLSIAAPAVAATGPPWGRSTYLYDDRAPRRLATPPWSAYVKIAEGCDHTCSFCAIPAFRGKFRSRRLGSILREAESLVRSGVREINLIAQDSSDFGRDLGLRDGLVRLLSGLDEIDGLRWIRLHYLYPNTVTDQLIEAMARLEKVVEYVDIPLQHADPETLRRMRRGGSAETHLRLLARFRDAMPGAAVRSTFIVGFPGETEQEFETLLDFVLRARFDHLGAFKYSHEEGTRALADADDVPAEIKQSRLDRLMACQQEIALRRNRALVGREVEVLVEGAHPETEHLLVGRMSTQAMDVDGQVLINDGVARPGEFARVELTGTAGYDLVGRIHGPA